MSKSREQIVREYLIGACLYLAAVKMLLEKGDIEKALDIAKTGYDHLNSFLADFEVKEDQSKL